MAKKALWRTATCVFITLAFIPLKAEASITSVTVNTSKEYENADGYTYAEITIHGSVVRADGSAGFYSVPAVIIYPRHGRANGVGVVDWLNSAFYHFFPPVTEFGTFQFTLLATGNYLFEEGYTYVSIQWNKAVTEIFGPTAPLDGHAHNHLVYGSIGRSADAWEILLDAARLLKDPSVYPETDGPARVATVLSSGYSQGAAAQLEVLAENLDPTRVYHLPEPILPLGLPNQNIADARPIFRAAFDNLNTWTHGKHHDTPPEARYFEGSVDATDALIPTMDADGHVAGGLRLPHVESEVHGHVAGAPLGHYTPLNPLGLDPFHPFVFISGTFTRFSDDDLRARYASRDEYVKRVTRAADDLAAKGYITNEDRKALIAAARDEPLPAGIQ